MDHFQDLFIGGFNVQSVQVAPGGHGFPHRGVPKVEHVLDPLLFVFINGAFFAAQIHHHADLILGDIFLFGLHFQPQQRSTPLTEMLNSQITGRSTVAITRMTPQATLANS